MSRGQGYRRVTISGSLTTRSAFHTGTGEVAFQKRNEVTHPINVVAKDSQHRPYIPGSTIRGFLRHQIKDSSLHAFLFGAARQPVDSSLDGVIGALRVYDARFNGTYEQGLLSRTSIEPVTATARTHHLFSEEIVPIGSTFTVELLIDSTTSNITEESITTLMGALDRLNHLPIGRGNSVGQGYMTWTPATASTISDNDIRKWCQRPKGDPAKLLKKIVDKNTLSLQKRSDLFQASSDHLVPLPWTSLSFQLVNQGPLLINDPQAVDAIKLDEATSHTPQLITLQENRQFVIPGSTLKGWFRAQSRKILLTITQGTNECSVDTLLGELFGSADTEGSASLVRFDTALAPVKKTHEQSFNAIDRFTGGVKDSALFHTRAVAGGHTFTACLHINESKLKDWMKWVLLHIWSDAIRGDMRLGWGKSRGYGQMIMKAAQVVPHLVTVDEKQYQQWQTDLDNQLDRGAVDG